MLRRVSEDSAGGALTGEEASGLTRRRLFRAGAGVAAAAAIPGWATSALANAAAIPAAVNRGGTVKIGFSGVATNDNLDPATTTTSLGWAATGMIYNGLVRSDYNWNLTPALAEDWSVNKTGTRWVFKLRKGVEFHDGKSFSAADVEYSILRILNPKLGAEGFGTVSGFLTPKGVIVGDPHTVTFELEKPDAFFATKLAGFGFRIIENGQTNFLHGSHGTGPFKNVSFVGGQGFSFVKNPNYWESGLPYLDGVTAVDITDLATKAEAVLTGDVQLIDPPDFSQLSQMRSSSSVALWPTPGSAGNSFDIDSSALPYKNQNVSHALKMLIDRAKMAQVIAPGVAVVSADSLIPPDDIYYPKSLKPFPYDPAMAKQLLAKAGYGKGFKMKLVTTAAQPGLNEMCTIAQQEWSAAGLNVSIDNLDPDAWNSDFLKVPIFCDTYGRQHPIIMATSFMLSTSPANTTRLKDAQIDAWIGEVQKTLSRPKQIEIFGEILTRYNDVAAEIIPNWFNQPWVAGAKVKGLVFTPTDLVDMRRVYLA
jgi:peptide/nickel transport system substrate-binding protein